jgi:hypothetical protein
MTGRIVQHQDGSCEYQGRPGSLISKCVIEMWQWHIETGRNITMFANDSKFTIADKSLADYYRDEVDEPIVKE